MATFTVAVLMGFIVGQAAEEAAEEGQPSTAQRRKDAAAAAASYALIAPKLPAALEHQQRPSLPWYVLLSLIHI